VVIDDECVADVGDSKETAGDTLLQSVWGRFASFWLALFFFVFELSPNVLHLE
jgi:hypothetical protein